jgi:hypothetical protein
MKDTYTISYIINGVKAIWTTRAASEDEAIIELRAMYPGKRVRVFHVLSFNKY